MILKCTMEQEKTIDYNQHVFIRHTAVCPTTPKHTHTHNHKLVPDLMHHNTRMLICYVWKPPAVGIYNYTPLGDLNEG